MSERRKKIHRRQNAKPIDLNKNFIFQCELGYEPRQLTTASAWNLQKRYSNNPTWIDDDEERVFDLYPSVLDFGPMRVDHKYKLVLTFCNRGNFMARARLKSFKPQRLCSEDEDVIALSCHSVTLAPGCTKKIVVTLLGKQLGNFTTSIEVTTERRHYRIPVKAHIMEQLEHQEHLDLLQVAKKLGKMPSKNKPDEIELIDHGNEGVGNVWDGDQFANEISNAYINAKFDDFAKRLVIDNRERWVVRPSQHIDRKKLEAKYKETFKKAKSKWTALKDRYKSGGAIQSLFKKASAVEIGKTPRGEEGWEEKQKRLKKEEGKTDDTEKKVVEDTMQVAKGNQEA